jgi:hypothetical protein
MPKTHFYTDRYHILTSGITSGTIPRFDWFCTKDGAYLQLLALVQLCYPTVIDNKIVIKSIYFHISADTVRLIKSKHPTVNGNRYVITYFSMLLRTFQCYYVVTIFLQLFLTFLLSIILC